MKIVNIIKTLTKTLLTKEDDKKEPETRRKIKLN